MFSVLKILSHSAWNHNMWPKFFHCLIWRNLSSLLRCSFDNKNCRLTGTSSNWMIKIPRICIFSGIFLCDVSYLNLIIYSAHGHFLYISTWALCPIWGSAFVSQTSHSNDPILFDKIFLFRKFANSASLINYSLHYYTFPESAWPSCHLSYSW